MPRQQGEGDDGPCRDARCGDPRGGGAPRGGRGLGQVNPRSDDVIRRVDRIVEELVADVSRSIISRSMLEASNQRVLQAPLAGIQTPGAEGHKIIQASLRMGLCLELARVFDVGRRPIPKQDKASLPILAYYLVQPDVRQRLVARSGP